jgi:hypothetical protein
MKTLLAIYALYLFFCLGFGTKPTPEGCLLPIIISLCISCYCAIRANHDVNLYLSREQIENLSELSEAQDD